VSELRPGPQDYKTVETTTYMKRNKVIPKFAFTTAGKDLEPPSR